MIQNNTNFNKTSLLICQTSSNYGSSYYYTYMHPFVELFGILNGITSVLIISQKEVRKSGPFFQYELLFTIQSLLGTIITTGLTLTQCGPLCSFSTQYLSRVYEKYILLFVGQIILLADSLIQVSLSIQIYFSMKQSLIALSKLSPIKCTLATNLLCILLGSSILYVVDIKSYKCYLANSSGVQTVYYYLNSNDDGLVLKHMAKFVLIIANCICLMILVIVNCLLYRRLRKILNRKIALLGLNLNKARNSVGDVSSCGGGGGLTTNESESKRKTLIMVLWVSIAFFMGRLICVFNQIAFVIASNSVYNVYLSLLTLFWGICVFATRTFILYKTNKVFRKKFRQLVFRMNE